MSDSAQNAPVPNTSASHGNGHVLIPVSFGADLSANPVAITTPVWNTILQRLAPGQSVKIFVRYQSESSMLEWETTYMSQTLYIEVPHGRLSDSSKDAFTGLVEYATDVLRCIRVIIYFSRERDERDALIQTFMSLGLFAVPAESILLHVHDPSKIYMVCEISEP